MHQIDIDTYLDRSQPCSTRTSATITRLRLAPVRMHPHRATGRRLPAACRQRAATARRRPGSSPAAAALSCQGPARRPPCRGGPASLPTCWPCRANLHRAACKPARRACKTCTPRRQNLHAARAFPAAARAACGVSRGQGGSRPRLRACPSMALLDCHARAKRECSQACSMSVHVHNTQPVCARSFS